MALQLWKDGSGGHYFFDTDFGVQVGQAYMENDGRWVLEVNDEVISAQDLEQATGLFLAKYDCSLISLSPGSSGQRTHEKTGGSEIADIG